jgi:predicted transcriptional regulator
VLIERRVREGIIDGSITVLFRQWRRPQVVAGRRYRTSAGILEMQTVDVISLAEVTEPEARAAGFGSAAELAANLPLPADVPLYRLHFHRVAGPDPRDVLASTDELTDRDVAELERRLDRMDRHSTHGPWTRGVLAAIAAHPGVRAAELAAGFGREVFAFKNDVRKLKALGLTISLNVGYRLAPRGEAYLRRIWPELRRPDSVGGADDPPC